MNLEYVLLRWQSRNVWTDPVRKVRTLEGYARVETDGGHDIAAAAKQVHEPTLLKHLERHAREELHHGELFRDRAASLRRELGVAAIDETELDNAFDLTRGRDSHELDGHGFFRASLFDELGKISYVAMLHVAEKKAASLFRVHRDLTRDDPETCAIFEEILRDEKYHVAYTGALLKEWRKQGLGKEVRAALSEASGSRLLDGWKRLGIRAGAHFGRVLLLVLYWTVLAPFGALSRRAKPRKGWLKPPEAPAGATGTGAGETPPGDSPAADIRAQY